MPGDRIEEDDPEKEETGSHQIQDHVPDCGQRCTADLPHDHDSAGCQRHDLDENIPCENIVSPHKGHQSSRHQIDQGKVQTDLALVNVDDQKFPAGHDRAEKNDEEEEGRQRFEDAGADLISPGRREFPHRIRKGRTVLQRVKKHTGCQHDQDSLVDQCIDFCFLPLEHRTEHTGKKAQNDREKRKIPDNVHERTPLNETRHSGFIDPPSDVWIKGRRRPGPACDSACRA